MGVDGFRLDAIPYLVERDGTNNENLPETHEVIKQIRAALDRALRGPLLLAEANQWPEDVREYFGDGDECHMAYHFPLMPRMYMAIAQEDRYPVVEIMQQTPDIPDNCQWAIFLRNHDELTLEMVTSKERDYMYQMYAADPRARINLGIRRRLAPLMENDPDRIKLMNSLLLSMPGSPIIYYGDEIGMGDNIYLGDRNGVRTPMQWSPDRNAGFSRADPQRLYLPPIMDPIYGYEAVNVEAQLRDPSSLLNWMKRMLAVRKGSRAFGRGTLSFLTPGNRKILAYLREFDGEAILCVANLSRAAQAVELDLARFKARVPVELLGRTAFPPIGELPYMLTLPAHGFYWFRLATDIAGAALARGAAGAPKICRCSCCSTAGTASSAIASCRGASAWRKKRARSSRAKCCRGTSSCSAGTRAKAPRSSARASSTTRGGNEGGRQLAGGAARTRRSARQPGVLPAAGAGVGRQRRGAHPRAAAAASQGAPAGERGVHRRRFRRRGFCRALAEAIGARPGTARPRTAGCVFGRPRRLRNSPATHRCAARQPPQRAKQQHARSRSASGCSSRATGALQRGVNPEFEIGRFLTEVANFPNCVPLAGTLEYVGAKERALTLALLQAYVRTRAMPGRTRSIISSRYLEEQRVNVAGSASRRARRVTWR